MTKAKGESKKQKGDWFRRRG